MRIGILAGCICVLVGLGALAACSSSATEVPATPMAPSLATQTKETLFVVDYYGNAVDMLGYPSGKLLGVITGLNKPGSDCSDGAGNVWVANTGGSTIEEYSHTGSHIATLADDGYEPISCAYDPKSGDLAVGNFTSEESGPGNIALYTGASGKPKFYRSSKILIVNYVAYAGTTGTLYLDGANQSGRLFYGSFSKGKFKTIPVTGATIQYPGNLAWSSVTKSMNLQDSETYGEPIYQIAPSGKITGHVDLHCEGECNPYVLLDDHLVTVGTQLELFKYPQGGKAVKRISTGSYQFLAISPAISQ
jgi:hypothetical protein